MTARIGARRFRARPRTIEALIVEQAGTYEVEGYGVVALSRGVYEYRENVLIPLTQDQTDAFWEAFEEDTTPRETPTVPRAAWQRLR